MTGKQTDVFLGAGVSDFSGWIDQATLTFPRPRYSGSTDPA